MIPGKLEMMSITHDIQKVDNDLLNLQSQHLLKNTKGADDGGK